MIDLNFPYITYQKGHSPRQWGQMHGEKFKSGIQELFEIRKDLMLKRNPALEPYLEEMAFKQWAASEKLAPDIMDELQGICEGSGITKTQAVILNNYTDFRDIQLPDEGCSTIHIQNRDEAYAGQTWDMHSSAKRYVSVIDVPANGPSPHSIVFSLVGCVGMMGFNQHRCMIGVNNINTNKAENGVIWPVLVRKVLQSKTLGQMREQIKTAQVTSGHNYILSSVEGGEHWEKTPVLEECVGAAVKGEKKVVFHTNHCIGNEVKKYEDRKSLSSTTFIREGHLQAKASQMNSYEDLYAVLTNHEGHPKSICSHFTSGKQDPSMTCGGGTGDLTTGRLKMWRGCPVYDDNYVEYNFELDKEAKIYRRI